MVEKLLTHEGHTRRFTIVPATPEGWVVKEELDSQVLNRSRYRDWHRVERAVMLMVSRLERDGWVSA